MEQLTFKKIYFLILFFFHYVAFSQNVIYDVEQNRFTENSVSEIKKNDEGAVYLRKFNPFTHNKSVTAKNINNVDRLFPFVLNILGGYFGTKASVAESAESYGIANIKTNYDLFVESYNAHLDLVNLLKKQYYDCSEIDSSIAIINGSSKSLSELYDELTNDELKKFPDLNLSKINHLEAIKENVDEYSRKLVNGCDLKVATYKATGSGIEIAINLIPREEAINFGFPLSEIKAARKIIVKNTINISFSSGLFASMNIEPDYYTIEDSSGTFHIREENKGKIIPGVNSLAHINFSKSNDFSIIVGGGTTIEAIPHFLIGGSIRLFQSRLDLNFGYGWAYRKTLSDGLSLTELYIDKPTIKTKKRLNGDFWFGLSYRL